MSLYIDVDKVTHVLLADGWHEVADETFYIDAYEYVWHTSGPEDREDPELVHGGGRSGICASGFGMQTHEGDWIYAPLTALIAVRATKRSGSRDAIT